MSEVTHEPKPSKISTIGNYAKNKSVSFGLLGAAFYGYQRLAEAAAESNGPPMMFLEIYYALLSIFVVMVVGPLFRMCVFGEAADYAESGGLDRQLKYLKFTPAMVHYWIATIISYGVTIACLATLSK